MDTSHLSSTKDGNGRHKHSGLPLACHLRSPSCSPPRPHHAPSPSASRLPSYSPLRLSGLFSFYLPVPATLRWAARAVGAVTRRRRGTGAGRKGRRRRQDDGNNLGRRARHRGHLTLCCPPSWALSPPLSFSLVATSTSLPPPSYNFTLLTSASPICAPAALSAPSLIHFSTQYLHASHLSPAAWFMSCARVNALVATNVEKKTASRAYNSWTPVRQRIFYLLACLPPPYVARALPARLAQNRRRSNKRAYCYAARGTNNAPPSSAMRFFARSGFLCCLSRRCAAAWHPCASAACIETTLPLAPSLFNGMRERRLLSAYHRLHGMPIISGRHGADEHGTAWGMWAGDNVTRLRCVPTPHSAPLFLARHLPPRVSGIDAILYCNTLPASLLPRVSLPGSLKNLPAHRSAAPHRTLRCSSTFCLPRFDVVRDALPQ